jgi:hypothetical protein
MTPTNLAAILAAIVSIEADSDALDEEAPTFSVKLTFSRELLRSFSAVEVHRFADSPMPSNLFFDLRAALDTLRSFYDRERLWADEEKSFGGSIDDAINFLEFQVNRQEKTVAAAIEGKLYRNAIERLKQLRRRREAGNAPLSEAEQRRATDSAAWREEEYFGDKRRKAQEEARRRTSGQQDFSDWAFFFQAGFSDFYNRKGSNKTPWHEILGVSKVATRTQIKAAARKLAAKHHPDRGGSTDKMAEINAARDEGLARALDRST